MSDQNDKETEPRRALILKLLEDKGDSFLNEVQKEFPKTQPGQFELDYLALRKAGYPVKKIKGIPRIFTVKSVDLYKDREESEQTAKRAIGEAIAALLCGRREADQPVIQAIKLLDLLSNAGQKNSQKAALRTMKQKLWDDEIARKVEQAICEGKDALNAARQENARHIELFLRDYQAKGTKTIALDAGTSTVEVAKALKTMVDTENISMRVLTNATAIQVELENPNCQVDVLSVGGQLRKETRAYCGFLAERFLDTTCQGFHIDAAIVGTTSLINDATGAPRAFACDSDAEARIKKKFLEMAQFKAVVLDATKASKRSTSSFVFARVLASDVHAVITDERFPTEATRQIQEMGVAVIKVPLSESAKTSSAVGDEGSSATSESMTIAE